MQALVDRFVLDLEGLIRRQALSSVHAALGLVRGAPAVRPGKVTKVARTPKAVKATISAAPKPAPAPPGSRGRRTPQDLAAEADRLIVAIKAKPGSTVEQLKLATKISSPEIPVKNLLASKRITKTGEKRATRYFPG